jgi:cell division protein FtsB
MKKRILLAFVTVVLLLSIVLSGCSGGGIAQELYDQVTAQLKEAQDKLAEAQQNSSADLQAIKDNAEAELQAAQAKVAELEAQVNSLKSDYELTGATPAETAEKIVKNYHDTHVYSTYDLFICSDMAGEVWNMLKAQGISAVIVVGDIHNTIADILLCNHAWVLAEVAPGEKLALETTGGYAVPESENALYYRGWYFSSPSSLKSYNEEIREYNTLVIVRNQIVDEINKAMNLYNNSTNQIDADKYMAVYNKLVELKVVQENRLNELMSEVNQLATQL